VFWIFHEVHLTHIFQFQCLISSYASLGNKQIDRISDVLFRLPVHQISIDFIQKLIKNFLKRAQPMDLGDGSPQKLKQKVKLVYN